MVASTPAPAEVPLVVVGGGPTGIAALFEARRQGIEAVGLEAGPGPTPSIREYLNGLVLISRPTDSAIAGIPLDTRDPNQLTREEVLHYLGRVINYGGLDLRFHAPARELVAQDGRVLVRTPAGDWLARHVIVTAWYRRRRPPPSLVNPASGVEVIETLHDPVAVAGRRPVIVGGGMSAFEHATAVMMHGQPVAIVARHRLPGAFRTPHFETLVRDTGSRGASAGSTWPAAACTSAVRIPGFACRSTPPWWRSGTSPGARPRTTWRRARCRWPSPAGSSSRRPRRPGTCSGRSGRSASPPGPAPTWRCGPGTL